LYFIKLLYVQRTILDLICEILDVKFPTWSDEVSVALSAVDPSYPQDSWKLSEGFVVQEALSVLPHLAISTCVSKIITIY
jgi:rapamycin-insensitive companion of mTOR